MCSGPRVPSASVERRGGAELPPLTQQTPVGSSRLRVRCCAWRSPWSGGAKWHRVSCQVDGRQTQSEAQSFLGTDCVPLSPWMPMAASPLLSLVPFLLPPSHSPFGSHREKPSGLPSELGTKPKFLPWLRISSCPAGPLAPSSASSLTPLSPRPLGTSHTGLFQDPYTWPGLLTSGPLHMLFHLPAKSCLFSPALVCLTHASPCCSLSDSLSSSTGQAGPAARMRSAL